MSLKFPRHKAGMHIQHNNHKDYYESVETYLKSPWMEDVSEQEREDMIRTDEIWELTWYPDTPNGSYKVYGISFEEVLEKANRVQDDADQGSSLQERAI